MNRKPQHKKTAAVKAPKKKPEIIAARTARPYIKYLVLAIIIIVAALVYSSSVNNEFTNYDDDKNVTENIDVYSLSSESISHFFTKDYMGVYVPMTMLSYAIDYKIWGMDAHKFHLMNLLLHLINICLVFYLVLLLVPRLEAAAIVALLFAVHPVNVEGIAWISCRSSLLYTLFYLCALISYLHFLKKSKIAYAILSFLLFACSVLSKNAAVIFPVTLLLIDIYHKRRISLRMILEKVPFFLVSLAAGIVTLRVRTDAGATDLPFTYTIVDRFLLICYSLSDYLFTAVAPIKLSALYPWPFKTHGTLPVIFYVAPFFLIVLAFAVYKIKRLKKEIVFGLGFFFVNIILILLPLLEDGFTATRYAYVPFIGLFFIIGIFYISVRDNILRIPGIARTLLPFVIGAFVLFCSFTTYNRNKVWKNSATVWNDIIEKYPDAAFAYYGRANYYGAMGKNQEAVDDYSSALRLNPKYTQVYYYRGLSRGKVKDYKGALEDYNKAISLYSDYPLALNERAIILMDSANRRDAAMADLNKAIRLDPRYYGAYNNRGVLFGMQQKYTEAMADFNKALEINPNFAEAYKNRGFAYMLSGDKTSACADYNKAVKLGNKDAEELVKKNCK